MIHRARFQVTLETLTKMSQLLYVPSEEDLLANCTRNCTHYQSLNNVFKIINNAKEEIVSNQVQLVFYDTFLRLDAQISLWCSQFKYQSLYPADLWIALQGKKTELRQVTNIHNMIFRCDLTLGNLGQWCQNLKIKTQQWILFSVLSIMVRVCQIAFFFPFIFPSA